MRLQGFKYLESYVDDMNAICSVLSFDDAHQNDEYSCNMQR